jgi:hypothetical protein
MGKTFTEINESLREFVERQHLFFVATAPTSIDGHVNCSPKGLDSLRILGDTTVCYLDYTGSGAETIAHVRENGRIVLMFCAFEGPPNIVRFHGRGEVLLPGDTDFAELLALFTPGPGVRSIIRIELDRISDSCGFGVPYLKYESERTQLSSWATKKGDELATYRRNKNAVSIDGIAALPISDAEST